jgi:hypothetical protein
MRVRDAGGELGRESVVIRVGEIERDRALVAIHGEEVRRSAVGCGRRAPGPGFVAGGGFDLDHVGTEVAEGHGRQRPGEHAGEVGDEDALERRGGGHDPETIFPLPTI